MRFLYPENRKVLAYLREHEGETILCVANLSRTPQAVELDLSEFAGRVPVELTGGSLFPPIGELTYLLTLPPYGFYWFLLAERERLRRRGTRRRRSRCRNYRHARAARPARRALLEPAAARRSSARSLPAYLAKRRWFAAKDQTLRVGRASPIVDALPGGERELLLAESRSRRDGATQRWLLPLSMCWEDEPSRRRCRRSLRWRACAAAARVGLLTDAFALPSLRARRCWRRCADGARIETPEGQIVLRADARQGRGPAPPGRRARHVAVGRAVATAR